jgi:hypothetical protein
VDANVTGSHAALTEAAGQIPREVTAAALAAWGKLRDNVAGTNARAPLNAS